MAVVFFLCAAIWKCKPKIYCCGNDKTILVWQKMNLPFVYIIHN